MTLSRRALKRNYRYRVRLSGEATVQTVQNPAAWGFTSTVIDARDDSTGWSNTNGVTTTVAGAGPANESVIQHEVDTDGRTPTSLRTGLTGDLYQGGMFASLQKVNDLSKFDDFNTFLWRSPATSNGSYTRTDDLGIGSAASKNGNGFNRFARAEPGQWSVQLWEGRQMAAGGGSPAFDSNAANIDGTSFRTNGTGSGDAGLTMQHGMFRGNCKHNIATFIFTFDDSNGTDATVGEPKLTAEGWTATTYTIPSKIDSGGGALTSAQLNTLQAAGWTIGSHGVQTPGFSNISEMSYDEIVTELSSVKDFLQSRGYSGWPHYSYPEGENNEHAFRALRELGFKTARTLNTANSAGFVLAPGYSLHLLRSIGTSISTTGTGTWDSSLLTDIVDEAVAEGQIVIFYTHGLLSPTLSNGHTAPQAYQDLLDHIATAVGAGDAQVQTIDALYEEAISV